METESGTECALTRQLERDLRLVEAAVRMVGAGGATSVVVAGLSFAPAVLPEAERLAIEAGVRVVPLWTAEEQPFFDLCVEPVG